MNVNGTGTTSGSGTATGTGIVTGSGSSSIAPDSNRSATGSGTGQSPNVILGPGQIDLVKWLVAEGYALLSRPLCKRYTRAVLALTSTSGSADRDSSMDAPSLVNELLQAEAAAKSAHLNIWRYGDFLSDDPF